MHQGLDFWESWARPKNYNRPVRTHLDGRPFHAALDFQGFSGKRELKEKDDRELMQELYRQIGRLKVEVDFLKKKMGIFEP